ncbi:hypothetical protein L9F63_018203, partial [Diploptera punctata]
WLLTCHCLPFSMGVSLTYTLTKIFTAYANFHLDINRSLLLPLLFGCSKLCEVSVSHTVLDESTF